MCTLMAGLMVALGITGLAAREIHPAAGGWIHQRDCRSRQHADQGLLRPKIENMPGDFVGRIRVPARTFHDLAMETGSVVWRRYDLTARNISVIPGYIVALFGHRRLVVPFTVETIAHDLAAFRPALPSADSAVSRICSTAGHTGDGQ
jgi:hypothetical protein